MKTVLKPSHLRIVEACRMFAVLTDTDQLLSVGTYGACCDIISRCASVGLQWRYGAKLHELRARRWAERRKGGAL